MKPPPRPPTSTAPTVSWDGLTPGDDDTITEVNDTDLVVGTMVWSGGVNSVGSSSFSPDAGEAVACSITNTRIADIEVVETSEPAEVLPGGNVTWTIQVSDNGPSTALDVVLDDPIPTQSNLVAVNGPSGWDCSDSVLGNPGTVSCSKADMLPGEVRAFEIQTTVVPPTRGSINDRLVIGAALMPASRCCSSNSAAAVICSTGGQWPEPDSSGGSANRRPACGPVAASIRVPVALIAPARRGRDRVRAAHRGPSRRASSSGSVAPHPAGARVPTAPRHGGCIDRNSGRSASA